MLLFETRLLSIKMKKKSKLDISIAKLRNQMKMLKKEWIDIAEKIENGSSLAPGKEPDQDLILNPVLPETNEEIMLL